MRVHVKQKRYQDHVRSQTLAGLGNNAEGNWLNASSFGATEQSKIKNVLEGTKGKAGRRRRRAGRTAAE